MGKGMTMAGMVVAVLIFALFALDLIVGFPFKRASVPMDVLLALSAWTRLSQLVNAPRFRLTLRSAPRRMESSALGRLSICLPRGKD